MREEIKHPKADSEIDSPDRLKKATAVMKINCCLKASSLCDCYPYFDEGAADPSSHSQSDSLRLSATVCCSGCVEKSKVGAAVI